MATPRTAGSTTVAHRSAAPSRIGRRPRRQAGQRGPAGPVGVVGVVAQLPVEGRERRGELGGRGEPGGGQAAAQLGPMAADQQRSCTAQLRAPRSHGGGVAVGRQRGTGVAAHEMGHPASVTTRGRPRARTRKPCAIANTERPGPVHLPEGQPAGPSHV